MACVVGELCHATVNIGALVATLLETDKSVRYICLRNKGDEMNESLLKFRYSKHLHK